jgi:Spy/CpxP family protein refolding chaperone
MKLNRTLGLAIVATAVVGAGAALAATTTTSAPAATTPAPAPATNRHWHGHGGMLVGVMLRATRQLDLTPEQQSTIKGILSTARAQHQSAAGTAAMDITVLGNPGDPNYASALQSAKAQFETRMQKQMQLQSQIYNVLTPQQKAKLPEVLAAMQTQAQQRRAEWQAQHGAGSN